MTTREGNEQSAELKPFAEGTRGAQALQREAVLFSIGLDHHHVVVNVLVTLLFFTAHVLFVFGQLVALWEVQVAVNITGMGFDCPGIVEFTLPNISVHQQLANYSYTDIIAGAWGALDIGHLYPYSNIPFDLSINSKIFAIVIVLFSGCWPHAKLVATHILWYSRSNAKKRTKTMLWLEFLGKWSMVDVFSVVMVVTVFAIAFDGTFEHFMSNILDGVKPFIGAMADPAGLTHIICHGLVDWPEHPEQPPPAPSPSPTTCHGIVAPHLDNGEDAAEFLEFLNYTCKHGAGYTGFLDVELKADTLEGIYYFSAAVWLSLILSAFINMRNEQILIKRHKLRHATTKLLKDGYISGTDFKELLLDDDEQGRSDSDGDGGGGDYHLADFGGAPLPSRRPRRSRKKCDTLFGHAGFSPWLNAVVVVIVLAGLGCLYVTQFFVYTFRDLIGSTSHLVDLLNNKTDSEFRNYTMWQVSMNVLKGSGSNPFLQKDLVIFTIAGPAVCFLFSLVSAVVPMPRSVHWFVAKLAGLGFTFSGIEVLAFGLLLTTVILPAQSAGLIQIGGSAPFWWCLAMDHVYVTERGACVRSALLRPMCSRFYSLLCRCALGTVSATNPASTKR